MFVRGEVQNTGITNAEFVKIIVILYDAKGTVIGTDFTYIVPATKLAPLRSLCLSMKAPFKKRGMFDAIQSTASSDLWRPSR